MKKHKTHGWNSYSFGTTFNFSRNAKARSVTSADVKLASCKIQDFWNGSAEKQTLIYDFFSKEDRAILEAISTAIEKWNKRKRKSQIQIQQMSSMAASPDLINNDSTALVTDSEYETIVPLKSRDNGGRESIIKIDTALTPQVIEKTSGDSMNRLNSGDSMHVPSPSLTYAKSAPLSGSHSVQSYLASDSESVIEPHQQRLPTVNGVIEDTPSSVAQTDGPEISGRASVTIKDYKSFAHIDIGPVPSPVKLADFQDCVDKAIKKYMKDNPDRPWKSGGDNVADQPVLIYEHVAPRMALVWQMWMRMKGLKGKHEQWITAKLGDELNNYGVFGEEVAETLSRLYVLDDKEKDKWKLTSMLSIRDLKSFLEAFHFMLAYRPPSAMADFSNSDDIYGRAYMCTSSTMLAFTVCFTIFAVQFTSYYLLTTIDYGDASPRDIDDNVSLAKFCALLSLITFLIQDFWGSNLILAHGIYTSYDRINPRIIFPLMQLATVSMGFFAGVGGISRSDNVWDVFDNVVAVAFLSELDEWCVRHIVDDIREVNLNPPVSEMYWHLRYTFNQPRSTLEAAQNIYKSWRWRIIAIQIICVVGCIFAAIIVPLFNTVWEASESSERETWFWVYVVLTFFLGPVVCMGIMICLSPLDKKQTRVGVNKGVTKQIFDDMENLDAKINSLENSLKEDNDALNKNATEKIDDNKNRLQEVVETFQMFKETFSKIQTEGKERVANQIQEVETHQRQYASKYEEKLQSIREEVERMTSEDKAELESLRKEVETMKSEDKEKFQSVHEKLEKMNQSMEINGKSSDERLSSLEKEVHEIQQRKHISYRKQDNSINPPLQENLSGIWDRESATIAEDFLKNATTPALSPDNSVQSQLQDLIKRIELLEKENTDKNNRIAELEKDNDDKNSRIAELQQDNTDQNNMIVNLLEQNKNKQELTATLTPPPAEAPLANDTPGIIDSPLVQIDSPRERIFSIQKRGRAFQSLASLWARKVTLENAEKRNKRRPQRKDH